MQKQKWFVNSVLAPLPTPQRAGSAPELSESLDSSWLLLLWPPQDKHWTYTVLEVGPGQVSGSFLGRPSFSPRSPRAENCFPVVQLLLGMPLLSGVTAAPG